MPVFIDIENNKPRELSPEEQPISAQLTTLACFGLAVLQYLQVAENQDESTFQSISEICEFLDLDWRNPPVEGIPPELIPRGFRHDDLLIHNGHAVVNFGGVFFKI